MAASCHRGVLSCARCRKRKIKCDRILPQCSQCLNAHSECKGYDSVNEIEVPRSVVQHLEFEIARIETELGRGDQMTIPRTKPPVYPEKLAVDDDTYNRHGLDQQYDDREMSVTTVPEAEHSHTTKATPIGDASIVQYLPQTTLRFSILASPALQALVQATMPPTEPRFEDLFRRVRMGLTPSFILSSARDEVQRDSTIARSVDAQLDFSILLTLPADVVRSLVKKYIQHALPTYPILYEPRIWAQVDHVLSKVSEISLSGGNISSAGEGFNFLVVYLILAISATLGAAQSGQESRCLAFSAALFKEGVQHLSSKAPFPDDLAGVQATLLILQYAFINPLCANVWILSGAAIRSCLELGLHRDISGVKGMNPLLMDMRRRVFWVAYVMDRSICSALQRPLSIPDPAIDAQYPSILDDSCITVEGLDLSGKPTKLSALRSFEYSRLQSIMTEVHFQGGPLGKNQQWEDWLLEMTNKFQIWFESTSGLKDTSENALMHGLMSLHRPSPRVPMPKPESLLIAFECACKSARSYKHQIKAGISRRPWLAAHHTIESALVVIFCLRHNNRGIAERYSAQEIFESTKIVTSNLLSIASQGWAAISRYAGIYERLLGPLLEAVFGSGDTSALFTPAQDAELAELLYPGPAHLPSLRSGVKVPQSHDFSLFDASLFDFSYSLHEGGDLSDFLPLGDITSLV